LPLNKLDNFIKNTEGRILYVNPSDLDSTDSITNEGNSLAQPFKTVQRALLEAARFSYIRGNNNDLTEKTTILLFPGEHIIDNRPGFAIYNNNGVAYAVPEVGGVGNPAQNGGETGGLSLELDSNFDITQKNNILYRFNSVNGGVVVPRGTSIVGLDLRKTKVRPKYVPNPTDPNVPNSSIFKITGACYFWQFSLFDGDDTGLVYTNPRDFSSQFSSQPRFSHHKLTCFEYCDGVNYVNEDAFGELTDLDMYYSKVSNAYNSYREIENLSKFPQSSLSFAKRAPEWEIVGSFQPDPINISKVFSGNGSTPSNRVTVTTNLPHGLNSGTPIKIQDVRESDYNISTFVQDILSDTEFTYLLPTFRPNLNPTPQLDNATVTIETDTVSGASPYIFNISLRSVWGMNGMHADGSKASGFRSMVVAQFTAVSLQKDDRAFVKYNPTTRTYDSVSYTPVYGSALTSGSSQTNSEKVYHLDQDAIYRPGWETSHIKISNDSFIQIVSVFAIGFTYHFDVNSGGDASITNSNSNFGQIALKSSGYKKEAFDKDDHGYVTSIVAPKDIDTSIVDDIEWLSLDVVKTRTIANSQRLYLYGFVVESSTPISVTQGYKIGAKENDKLYIPFAPKGIDYSADIYMTGKDDQLSRHQKQYLVSGIVDTSATTGAAKFRIGEHNLETGEKIIVQSKKGDLPENLTEHVVYYAITNDVDTSLNQQQIRIAASYTYAFLKEAVQSYGGDPNNDIIITSRVSDKEAGDIGSPIQWDSANKQWYINVGANNEIYTSFLDPPTGEGYSETDETKYSESTDLAFVKRIADERGLDEKIYKLRVVIPKESFNAKTPDIGFVIQDSSFTGETEDGDILPTLKSTLSLNEPRYRRNQRFIANCSIVNNLITVTTESQHKLKVNDIVIIRDVKDDIETATGEFNLGYNGSFIVNEVINDLEFTYSNTDIAGIIHNPGNFTNNTSLRTVSELPRVEKNDNRSNLYIYRNDVISEYNFGVSDGIYHLYVLNANNSNSLTFSDYKYTQSPVDLYPQLDRDNIDSNPKASRTFAKRAPVGDVVTNDLKKSISRESIDIFCKDFGLGLEIESVSTTQQPTATINFNKNHGFGSVVDGTLVAGTGGRINGTYYNVKLFNDSNQTVWNGATAKVVVSGGSITSYEFMSRGSGYAGGDTLYFDIDNIGGSANAYIQLSTVGITTNIGDVLQITGDGFTNDGYYRITSVNDKNTVTVARHSGDPAISAGQYAFNCGRSVRVQSTSFTETETIIDGETQITVGLVSFTTYTEHGLNVGNKFRVTSSSNQNLGDYVVKDILSPTFFNASSQTDLPASAVNGYILKHGLSSNQGISDVRSESYSARTVPFYAGESFKLLSTVNAGSETTLSIECLTGISTSKRLQVGDYLQVNDEIMRVRSTPSDTSVQVHRGYMGTRQGTHATNSIIKKINVIPLEFRRPSILRASGHTFEYLGYGPGNYSTALPQVQLKTLSDREDFLVQAQERSAGAVIYTGMNSKGDVFNGNTKVSASSGQTISYDIPKPTITGQDPSKLSVVFDEVTVRERILVEGGTSGYVLSQFDGPVTLTKSLRVKGKTTLNGQLRITNNNENFGNDNSGALIVRGGVGIGKNVYIRGRLEVANVIRTNTGIVPDEDFGAYIGTPGVAYTSAYIGNIEISPIGLGNSNTIKTRSGGLTIDATNGNLTQTASGAVSITASGGNLTQTASGAVSVTASGGNLTQTASSTITQTASSAINQTATTGKVTIVASANDVEVNAGTGKSISLKKTTYVTGNLDVKAFDSVPPGTNSGTVSANYIDSPNITPIGGIVLWSGDSNALPTISIGGNTVNMWTVCDGKEISRTAYSTLFGIIGTRYGSGNGSSTFNLPDLRNRFIVGSNSDSGSNIEVTGTNRSGGQKDLELVTHDHSPFSLAGGHDHSPYAVLNVDAPHTHPHGHPDDISADVQPANTNHSHPFSTGSNGSHSHANIEEVGFDNKGNSNSYRFTANDGASWPYSDPDKETDTSLVRQMSAGSDHVHTGTTNTVSPNHVHDHPVSMSGSVKGVTAGGSAPHNHPMTLSPVSDHIHPISSAGTTDGTNKNLPPYYALYYIMRIL
jgi:microcystin-dependent protein